MVDLNIIQKAYEGDNSPEVRLYVFSAYIELFGKEIANPDCQNCVRDAAIEILIKMNDTRKYLLHAHIPILHKGKWFTQPTLSDEDAEAYLTEHPEDAHKFKRLPKTTKKPSK